MPQNYVSASLKPRNEYGVTRNPLQMLTIKYNLTLPHQPDSFHTGRLCSIKFSFDIREKQDFTRRKSDMPNNLAIGINLLLRANGGVKSPYFV
jgi:hypothetical protein